MGKDSKNRKAKPEAKILLDNPRKFVDLLKVTNNGKIGRAHV